MDKPIQIYDDDVLTLQGPQGKLYNICCDCGLGHEILFKIDGNELQLQFIRVDKEDQKYWIVDNDLVQISKFYETD